MGQDGVFLPSDVAVPSVGEDSWMNSVLSPGGRLATEDIRVSKRRVCSQELTENLQGHTGKLRAGLARALEAESAGKKTPRQGSPVVSSQWQGVGLQHTRGN